MQSSEGDGVTHAVEMFGQVVESAPGVLAAFFASKIGASLLKPTTDLLGEKLKHVVQRKFDNVQRLDSLAQKRAKGRDIALANIRVLDAVLESGSRFEDELMSEYVVQMLLGASELGSADDRAAQQVQLLDSMTADQVRLFHAIYITFFHQGDHEPSLGERLDAQGDTVFLGLDGLAEWGYGGDTDRIFPSSALPRLAHLGLISTVAYGLIEATGVGGEDYFIRVRPSLLGVLLFDWAYGYTDEDFSQFFSRDRSAIPMLNTPVPGASVMNPSEHAPTSKSI